VREFGMGAIMNGVVLHGGYVPFGGTFLVFSDYARSSLRMASIIEAGSIFVLTHDSIGLGEDGPTHQPVEHVASLRMIPRMELWRPCDTAETWHAWGAAIRRRKAPTILALTRQALPQQARDAAQLAAVARGGYVLLDGGGRADCILIATGSKWHSRSRPRACSRSAAGEFASCPCPAPAYSIRRMPPGATRCCRRTSRPGSRSRPACPTAWWRYVGPRGRVIGMTSFGASARPRTCSGISVSLPLPLSRRRSHC
jgi:transketolase